MAIQDVLVRPLITEKGSSQLTGADTYVFEVGMAANKSQIKRAVEEFYGVVVTSVRTSIVRGKTKRFGRFTGKRSNWKKAYVTLSGGASINIYES